MPMKIAILAALPREISRLVRGSKPDASQLGDGVWLYRLEWAVVVAAGMGAERAELAVEVALAASEFESGTSGSGTLETLISVGLAGACVPQAEPGSVLEANWVVDARTGERFATAKRSGSSVTLATAETIASVEMKARLAEIYGASLVDMEAATVARIARAKGLGFRAIKGVSDAYDFELSSLERFNGKRGSFRTGAFARYTALRPWTWGRAMTLGRGSEKALVALDVVRIDTCGICGTDLKKIHTGSHAAPRVFGHEMAGTIATVGDGVRGFAVGDRVMAFHHIPCGHCFYCRKKTFAQCETYKKVGTTAGVGLPAGGGFSQYIRVMDWIVSPQAAGEGLTSALTPAGLIHLPDDIPFEQAAFIEPVNTCFKAIRLLELEPDDTVLVIGQGSIGILLAALARQTGATVLTSDMYPERHAIARQYGLDHPIIVSNAATGASGDVVAECKAVTAGRGADVALVAVGADALIATAMEAIRPGGRVMLFASTQHGTAAFDPAAVCMDEKTLMGSYSASVAIQQEGIDLVFEGYRSGKLDLTKLISHRFDLKDAAEAIDLASHPQADSMKIVLKP